MVMIPVEEIDPDRLLRFDVSIVIPPKHLPSHLGPAPVNYDKEAWTPILKYFTDKNEREYTIFEDFISRFIYYLRIDNTEMEPEGNWYSSIKPVKYLIEIHTRGILRSEVVSAKCIEIDKYIYRIFHNKQEGEVFKLQDSNRILSITIDSILNESLESIEIHFVKIDDKSILFYRILFISTLTRFYRFFYFKSQLG
jgi:hypothetical protein